MKQFFIAPLWLCAAGVFLYAQEPPQSPPPTPQTPAAPAAQQTTAPATQQTPAPLPPPPPKPASTGSTHHLSVGVRARDFPLRSLSVMQSQTTLTTTTPVVTRDWNFTTSSRSSIWGVGLALEYAVSDHFTFTLDVMYDKLSYTKVTGVAWGVTDPSQTTDQRTHMFFNEATTGKLFDVPLMVHYRGLRPVGPLSKLFVAAGVSGRTVTSIRTTLVTTYPDTSTATTNVAARPSKRDVFGGVIGLGYRVVDDFNIHWTPEVRFTRWAGSTFSTDSTVSPRNQFEVNLGITF